MNSKQKAKPDSPSAERRQMEAAKITRLRALRLAKEAADREASASAAAEHPRKAGRRGRSPAAAS